MGYCECHNPDAVSTLTRIVKNLFSRYRVTHDANPNPLLRVVNVFLKTVNKSNGYFFGCLTGTEVSDSGNGVRVHNRG